MLRIWWRTPGDKAASRLAPRLTAGPSASSEGGPARTLCNLSPDAVARIVPLWYNSRRDGGGYFFERALAGAVPAPATATPLKRVCKTD